MPRQKYTRIFGIGKVYRRPAKARANPWMATVYLHDGTLIHKVFPTEETGIEWVKSFNT